MSDNAVSLDFATISQKLHQLTNTLPEIDLVVGIATGGIVPASMVAHQLQKPLRLLHLNYRAPDNTPRHPHPMLLSPFDAPINQHILLVDDVSVTGSTMTQAKELLPDNTIYTLVLKGQGADYVVFTQIETCVNWPWKFAQPQIT